jgi:hypothetical protein
MAEGVTQVFKTLKTIIPHAPGLFEDNTFADTVEELNKFPQMDEDMRASIITQVQEQMSYMTEERFKFFNPNK